MDKHIYIITGSRAEWGILRPLYQELCRRVKSVSLVITGSHLHAQSGVSASEIEADTGVSHHKVYITPDESGKNNRKLMFTTMANAIERFASFFAKHKPDLVVYLGDRYEIYAAATACRLSGIRSAHISGGEITAGAFDDVLRHCLTKLSDLHFTATEEYRHRVIQLGEDPQLVFNSGELALADLDLMPFLSLDQLQKDLGCSLNDFFLITIHPQTCKPGHAVHGLKKLLPQLRQLHPRTRLVFTSANADPEGEEINAWIKAQSQLEPEFVNFYETLGRRRYLSTARLARCVIGNSSSGIIEVPALGVPVLNLGRRQHGRPHSQAVITAEFADNAINAALTKLLSTGFREQCSKFSNPYAGKDSARKIADIIAKFDLSRISAEKPFYDLPF